MFKKSLVYANLFLADRINLNAIFLNNSANVFQVGKVSPVFFMQCFASANINHLSEEVF